ncbi:oxidoreductase [Lophiostoma macrostomum CBS 122681]|uniref:Oxidoreductase n=1 Tax=Lophiostoma macrostomum CBS 122681 TaxID=1314788 RepID=A0A6A6T3S2_9PLEO|nr:oxidoreductase [Lophiostoma macrostomum CBS 122681]
MADAKAGVNFDPTKDIPDLSGKVIFITGGTSGIGASTLKSLAAHNPSQIYFTGRNEASGSALVSSLKTSYPSTNLTFIKTDMVSLSSVQSSIRTHFTNTRLDILICNAGIMAQPATLSADGYEIQFAVNHLAHAMTIRTLLPTLLATAEQPEADVRIITLSSRGYRFHPTPGILFDELSSHSAISRLFLGPRIRYGQSKLANILHTTSLASHYPRITSLSIHPGVVSTDLVTKSSFLNRWMIYAGCWVAGIRIVDAEEGAWNTLWAATNPDAKAGAGARNGGFYMPVGIDGTESVLDERAKDKALAEGLWDWTEDVLGKV